MADSTLLINDAAGVPREIATDLVGTVHTPKHVVTGPLTDTQLRATAVPVSGPLTDTQLRATAVPVSGPLTDGQLRATAVPVSGPLTDTQLRATAVPVSGPLTDSQLRAAVLAVTEKSNNEAPISCGTYTLPISSSTTSIAIPAGTTGFRLYPRTDNVLFRLDSAPAAPAADTLGAGGFALSGQLRVFRLPAGSYTNLILRSTDGAATTDIDVEFFGV
jgi:hypothetical protein